jgi:hypothetical protein
MQETLVTITLALRVSKQSEECKLDTGKEKIDDSRPVKEIALSPQQKEVSERERESTWEIYRD